MRGNGGRQWIQWENAFNCIIYPTLVGHRGRISDHINLTDTYLREVDRWEFQGLKYWEFTSKHRGNNTPSNQINIKSTLEKRRSK